jgi:hypothetical protein
VYLVISGKHEPTIVGAFSTEEKAELTRAAVLARHMRDNPKRRRVERIVRRETSEET